MNTTTLPRCSRPIFGKTTHAIGADTENVTFNLPRRAFKVMNEFLKGKNRSDNLRRYIAEGIQREDTWSGLAFRAACKIGDKAKDFWAVITSRNVPLEEKAEVFNQKPEPIAVNLPEHPRVIAKDCLSEFDNDATNFIPSEKGAK